MNSRHSQLLDQLDTLEREKRDVAREEEWEKSQLDHLEEIINRDLEKEQVLSRQITDISKEILEWKEREHFQHEAIVSSYQNYQVLLKVEVEGKTKLEQEVKKTEDLMNSMKSKFDEFEKNYIEKMEIIGGLPGLTERMKIEAMEKELAGIEEENKNLVNQAENGRTDWDSFLKSCIRLSEKGKEAEEKFKKQEISRAVLKSTSENVEDVSVEDMEDDSQADDMDTAELDSFNLDEELETNIKSPEKEMAVSVETLSLSEGETSQEKLSTQEDPVNVLCSNEPQVTSPIQDGEKLTADIQDVESNSEEKQTSSPKPKRHFPLGSSIMSTLRKGLGVTKKSGKQGSRHESSDVEMDDASEEASSEMPPAFSPEPLQPRPTPGPRPQMKSFKLGLPSVFQKKKASQNLIKPRAETKTGTDGAGRSSGTAADVSAAGSPSLTQTKEQEVASSSPGKKSEVSRPQQRLEPLAVERTVEVVNRRSLDQFLPGQLNAPDLTLPRPKGETDPKLMQKSLTLPKLAVSKISTQSPVSDVHDVPVKEVPKLSVVLPRTNPLPKIAALKKPPSAFSMKKIAPTLPALNSLPSLEKEETEKIRPTQVTPAETGVQVPVKPNIVHQYHSATETPEKTDQDPMMTDALKNFSSPHKERSKKTTLPSLFDSPQQDQASSVTSIFGSNFLASPTAGEDFSFSLFGDKSGKEDGEDEDENFFGDFGGSLSQDGGFSLFGAEGKEAGKEEDFFSLGEDGKDGGDGDEGFSLF